VKAQIVTVDGAEVPQYQTRGAVGFDIAACKSIKIAPKEFALISTGLIIKVPQGCALGILPRSSIPKKTGLIIPHGIGIIDNDYHGPDDEILVQLYNISKKTVIVKKGDRIAQGLFFKIAKVEFKKLSKQIKKSSRGGFGSTK